MGKTIKRILCFSRHIRPYHKTSVFRKDCKMKIIHLETRESYYIDFQRGRGEERMTGPVCSSTRKKKSVKCFSWNHDKEMGFCSHCQAKFVAYSEQVDNYVKPEWKNNTDLSEKVVKW